MTELTRDFVGRPWIGGWRGGDRNVALKHKLMLGVISAMLGALLARLHSGQTAFPGRNQPGQCG